MLPRREEFKVFKGIVHAAVVAVVNDPPRRDEVSRLLPPRKVVLKDAVARKIAGAGVVGRGCDPTIRCGHEESVTHSCKRCQLTN